MTTLYSKASADFMTLGTFNTLANGTGTDTIPTAADDLILQNGHNVTIGTTTAVAKTITAQSGSTLTHSTAANSKLTISGTCTFNSGSTHACDLSSVPSITTSVESTISTTITYQNGANVTLKGAPKTRWTTLTAGVTGGASTSCSVAASSGWNTGDLLIFESTSAYDGTYRIDVKNSSGSPTDFASAVTYSHASGGMVGNFSSNVTFTTTTPASLALSLLFDSPQFSAYTACSRAVRDVLFYNAPVRFNGRADSDVYSFIGNCASYQCTGIALYTSGYVQNAAKIVTVTDWIIYASVASDSQMRNASDGGGFYYSNLCVFRADYGMLSTGLAQRMSGLRFSHCGSGQYGINPSAGSQGVTIEDSYFNNASFPLGLIGAMTFNRCDIGTRFSATNNTSGVGLRFSGFCQVDWNDCNVQASLNYDGDTNGTLGSEFNALLKGSYFRFRNKNRDVTLQELYTPIGAVFRENSGTKRSTSIFRLRPIITATDFQKTVSIPCANGATVRVVGYCKASTTFYNGGGSNWTAPTVSLSGAINGVTLTPDTFTASSAANNAFEFFDIDITNSSGADGNVALTFTVNAKSVVGDVYFDGTPTGDEFVTKARHYGFVFDQTLPQAVVNGAVSANEATAGAYTGITVTGGTSVSPITLGASKTFQQVYDYTQAWACTTANLGYAVPVTSPVQTVLVAASNVTTTGYSLTGGSIVMGSFTLTSEMTAGGYDFTYTGGTYSQAVAGSPSFNGGTLTLGAEATLTFTATDATIDFDPSANGVTYQMGGGTFSGTITLTNTSSHTCTVELPTPSGFSIVNSTSGANLITVVTPTVHNYVNATVLANTRVVLYNVTQDAEIDNQFIAGTSYSFEITTEADDGDTLDLFYFKEGYAEGRTRFAWGAATQTVAVEQATDPVIQAFRTEDSITDYTTITEFNVYAPTIYIQADDGDGVTKVSRLAIFYNGILTTEDGARYFRGGMSALSTGAVRVNKSVVELLLENVSATLSLRFSDEATRRLYTDDGTSIIAPSSVPGSIEYAYGGVPDTVETGVSGLTGPESAAVVAMGSAASNMEFTGANLSVNVKMVNDILLAGNGTSQPMRAAP